MHRKSTTLSAPTSPCLPMKIMQRFVVLGQQRAERIDLKLRQTARAVILVVASDIRLSGRYEAAGEFQEVADAPQRVALVVIFGLTKQMAATNALNRLRSSILRHSQAFVKPQNFLPVGLRL